MLYRNAPTLMSCSF